MNNSDTKRHNDQKEILHRKDIRITRPRTDCRWVRIHNFVDFAGNHLDEQYAECTNQIKSWGMVSIDITKEGNPLEWETSCENCKYYETTNQLLLFND